MMMMMMMMMMMSIECHTNLAEGTYFIITFNAYPTLFSLAYLLLRIKVTGRRTINHTGFSLTFSLILKAVSSVFFLNRCSFTALSRIFLLDEASSFRFSHLLLSIRKCIKISSENSELIPDRNFAFLLMEVILSSSAFM